MRWGLVIAMTVTVSLVAWVATLDARYLLDTINRFVMPKGPVVVMDPIHVPWRNTTRQSASKFQEELLAWQGRGNCFPDLTALTDQKYFLEVDPQTMGKAQKRTWGFLWLRFYGHDTRLAKEFPEIMAVYNSLPVNIYSIGISALEPGRGDTTHFGEYRGTWRQLLTIETNADERTLLGLYPHGDGQCDSIWTHPDTFEAECRGSMAAPLVHRYVSGKDILFDDSVWHFVDNKSQKRRVALWIDVARTDLGWLQGGLNWIIMLLATHANPEVTDTISLVNAINYAALCDKKDPIDDAPLGPLEAYDATKLIDVDAGFE